MTQQARNRKWIGYDPQEDSQEGAYVYITPYGSVYHRDISCSYLNPSIHCVDIAEIDEKRNLDGSRYEICGQCGDRPGTSSYVYVTDYGEVYHRALDCGGLRRTVYRVLLEEAAGYGLCSKCGNRE